MTNDTIIATITIPAPAETVFDVLADPTTHAAIDGTGWVREALDTEPVTCAGQVFRVAMYHENHPERNYEMANKVVVFDRPDTIAWEPGQDAARDGNLSFGGWIWRYDLRDEGSSELTSRLLTTGPQWHRNSVSTFHFRRSTPYTSRIRSSTCQIWPRPTSSAESGQMIVQSRTRTTTFPFAVRFSSEAIAAAASASG